MNEKLFTYGQIGVHLACFIASFYIIWPMSNHLSDFHGHCALFSCGTFSEDDGHFEPHWSSCGFCAFSIIVGVYTLLSSVGQILAKVRRLYQVRDCTFALAAIDFLLDCLMVLLVLIGSILITTGAYEWCKCVTQRFSSCDIAASVMVIGSTNSTINATNFSIQLDTLQFGIWTLFVVAVLQLMLSTKRALLYHEQENLVVSMARERQRFQNSYS
ncbi:hypothetical protein TYRP_017930 [Tyrophagus putrescentiae]|nr:hypothetical protein TYRP_017930 [Tyrophagus putrescentiae]